MIPYDHILINGLYKMYLMLSMV